MKNIVIAGDVAMDWIGWEIPLLAPFPQFRKNAFDEVVPLGMHIVERAAMKTLTVCQDVDMDMRDAVL